METENSPLAELTAALSDLKQNLTAVMASSGDKSSKEQVRYVLTLAHACARRVEAAKAVQGGYGGSMLGLLDQVLQIATPLAAVFGDFELSNLLGSLKVWLDRERMREEQEQLRRERNMSQTADDLTFTYEF